MHYLYSFAAFLGVAVCIFGIFRILITASKNKEDTKKYNTAFGIFIFVGLVLFFVGKHYWNVDTKPSNSVSVSNSGTHSETKYINTGQDAVFNKDGLAATTKELHDQLVKYAVAGNEDAVKRMIDRGEVISLPKGTQVTVVNRSSTGTAEIEILDKPFAGKKAFVIIEDLDPK